MGTTKNLPRSTINQALCRGVFKKKITFAVSKVVKNWAPFFVDSLFLETSPSLGWGNLIKNWIPMWYLKKPRRYQSRRSVPKSAPFFDFFRRDYVPQYVPIDHFCWGLAKNSASQVGKASGFTNFTIRDIYSTFMEFTVNLWVGPKDISVFGNLSLPRLLRSCCVDRFVFSWFHRFM